ncbi:uncharacterized protein ATNIH1004_006403 [Aspergillus tanneri]|uniref:Protein kinase domain-containing protein n=1 Tax=Aspergillus tanneri TaxID=1220188 RepID=A0A5M9MP75_9EURO|nr:uncharacterized protein ATNIH1004_006403 [Aspergillus tanneri]KAA8647706.1 hypothetical protein ATNIH1004_006403 [Aspergillus tanneri]
MVLCGLRRKIEQPCQQNIIGVGQFAIVHKLNNKIVRKVPLDKSFIYSTRALEIEGRVYSHLGKHKRIARCISWSDDFVDLRYECNSDLESYLKKNSLTSHAKCRIARQAVEAVVFIHGKDVIHSDLSACQFLVDKNCNIRLSDFGGSSLQGSEAIVMETASHFLPRDEGSPNTIQSDLFALGSTVYEIFLGKKPYEGMEEEEVQRLFSEKEASTHKISLDEEPALVKQMIEYLYTLDYQVDPHVPVSDACVSDENILAKSSELQEGEDTPSTYKPACTSDPLSFHILMYSLADRLFIQGLKALSRQNVQQELVQRLNANSFPQAILEIYNSTPENDRGLRDLVVKITMDHLTTLRSADEAEAAAFQDDLLKSVPQFSYDLLVAIMNKSVSIWNQGEECKKNWLKKTWVWPV